MLCSSFQALRCNRARLANGHRGYHELHTIAHAKAPHQVPQMRLDRSFFQIEQISFVSRPRRDSIEIPSHIWLRMENALAHAA
jgi:hypothetical protein